MWLRDRAPAQHMECCELNVHPHTYLHTPIPANRMHKMSKILTPHLASQTYSRCHILKVTGVAQK